MPIPRIATATIPRKIYIPCLSLELAWLTLRAILPCAPESEDLVLALRAETEDDLYLLSSCLVEQNLQSFAWA
jgi:hypothetical protein